MKSFFHGKAKLFLKQTITALLFAAIMLGMQATHKAPFSSYAEALGRALRYESDLSQIETLTDFITTRLGRW